MFEIEKLENNIVDLVEILNDRELLKLDKFKNIYQINKKINNNLNNFLSGLNLRKIKNLSEVKVKINLNLNYFKNFSFIKEKYNLNEIFELSFEEQKKLNNKILKELISYFNKKKYEIPSVIWLGYQDEKKCNNLVQEIDFFSNNIENNFEIFFNKIQKFNNIEKTNAINFYQKTLNKFSDNDLIKNKLLKINKNFFSFDEYLLFKDNLDDNFDESMLSDQSSNETELTLINNSIAIKDLVEELIVKKINLEELASVSEILPDENLKQLTIFTNKFIKETNNNINEKIILHYYPDSKSTKNFEDFSFYITDDIEDTIKKINQYFNKAETNIKITALEKMANFFNFSKQFTTLQKNINDFGTLKDVDNIKEFLKENATIHKLLEKTPYYHLLESFNYNSTDKKEDIYGEIFVNYNNIDFDNFFTAETFRTIISGINDHLNHNTIIKYYNNEQKEKFSSLIYEINTQVRDNFSENIDDNLKKPVEHLKNTSSDLVYKNLNNEDILNFFRLFSNNGVEEDDFNTLNNNFTFLSISTEIDKLIAKKINNIFTEVLNYSNFEINKYRHIDNIEKFWNDQKNQDRINNFVNNNKDPYEWNKLNRFQFQIWKDLKEIEKINKIFINNYLDQKQLLPPVDFKNKLDTLFLILTKYKLIKDWNFDMAYIKFQKLIASVFTIEINKTFFGVSSNEINIRNEIVKFLNIPKNILPHEKIIEEGNKLFDKFKKHIYDLDGTVDSFFLSQKKEIDAKISKIKLSYETLKNDIFKWEENDFIGSFFSDSEKKQIFISISEVESLIKELPSTDKNTYLKYLNTYSNFSSFLSNTNSKLKNTIKKTNEKIYEKFFEKFDQKLTSKNLYSANNFTNFNVENFAQIADINKIFGEIYNLDILKDLKVNNPFKIGNIDSNRLGLANKLINIFKSKNFSDFDNYNYNFSIINEFLREVLIAKKDIEQNIFSKRLEVITLLNNDPFSQEKEEVIDLLKKYQIQSIYKTHSLNPKILKKYFKLTNENDITLDFLLKNEDEVKRIKSQFNNNKLNFINLSSELSDKYEQIKIDFPKDTAFINELDTHFNNLKSNIDKATSSVTFDLSHNFSIKTTYANSSFKIDFTKDENEFNINEMLKTRSIIKNFFNFLFSKVFINITKEKTDNFSLIIWDKTIEDSSFFETYYEDWKNNNFEKSFVSKNNIDFFTQINPQTNKLSFYDEINKIKSEFNETKKLTSVFDEFKEEEEKFFYLAKENLTIDKILLENIDLDNYFFLDEFKKDLKDAIESKDFNKLKKYNNFDLNNLNSFDELKNKINDVINFLLDNNILLTKNIFNIVNDKFLEFNSINPKVDFINNFLTSANKDKLKELFNVFNLNSKLSYDNLKILQNTTHYQEELETYPLDNTNKAKNLDNKKNITTLINIFPDFEAYFLICGKGYLFFNSELIDQNKFNNFLQNNGNDFDTKDEYKNNYFDFNDSSYPKHLLNNVIKEWNVWSIEKMHTELFLQSDDFLLFYDKMKNLIKIKNDNSSSSFTDNLNLNNNNFKNNLITAAINKLESDWNKFFEEIIKDYPIFNYLDKVNSEKTKKQLEISDKLNSISRNLVRDTFLKEIQEKEQKLALDSQQEKDKWLFIFINELHSNLKNDQKITQLINKIPDSILKEIKLELEDYFKLYFLDIEDLKLTDHELQTKYLAKDGSNYVFNNEKNRNQFYENLKIYANFDTYKKNFYYKLLILKDLKEYSKKVLEGNFLDFNEVIEYKNTLKKKYITNNIPLDEEEIIKKIIEDNGKDELFIDNLKLLIEQKTSSFYIFNKNPSLITEIDNNLAISAEEKIIKDIFLNKKSDLLIEKYKENQNLKDNPFSKDNIFKKIEEYKEIGKKTVLISNLDYLRDEINNFIKKQYYKDIYLAQLNKTKLFSKIINDLDDLYQKNQAANSLGNNYKIFFDNKAIDLLSIEHKKLKEETETFLSEKKVTVFYEIADHFYKKYQKIIRDYQGFDINIEENDNHKNVKILFEYFDKNYGRSTFDKKTILQIIENKNLEENLSIFENYLKSIEIKIINVIKGSIYNLLKEIKENSIIFDLGSNFNIKNYTIKSLKWFKLNIPLALNFELWSNESYVNLKKVYDLLLTNHLIVNRSAYSYTHFTNELNDLKNTYFDYEKEIIEIILKDIVAFYNTLDQHYKGYHYPTKEKFNLNYQKFKDEFNNLSNKKEKIYFLTSYSEKGSAFREFIDDQDKQLLDQKSSIAKKIISENFYGYDFEKNQAGEWWYSKKPAYINEIMDEKIQRGANASDILNKKFLDPVRISDLKELVKTNIVFVDLNKLVKEQSKYFFNYWYQDFNKVIDNPPIDEDKTIELINNHYFNFYAIAKNFYDKINKLEAEQNESFKKYKLIVNKSLGFHKSNSIINVENVEKTRNSLLLVREKENIYSITNSTLLEKYFVIGIDYGFLLVLKTNHLTKDLENCTFSKKVFYDLNNNRSTSLDNTEIQFLDNKIVFSDTKTGKFLNITYNNFFDDIKDISDIEPEDLKVIKNFYQFPKNKKVEIEHNFYLEGVVKETFYSNWILPYNFNSPLWKIQTFFYKDKKNIPSNKLTKNVVAFDLYNKDNNLLIIFNNVNTESSLQKEFIYTINLKEMSKAKTWDITQYLINKNIDYVAKEFDNVGLKKTAKALPYIIGGVITLGLSFIVFFVLKKYMNYKKLQKEVTVKDKKDKKK